MNTTRDSRVWSAAVMMSLGKRTLKKSALVATSAICDKSVTKPYKTERFARHKLETCSWTV
jgi:hypothetical protein